MAIVRLSGNVSKKSRALFKCLVTAATAVNKEDIRRASINVFEEVLDHVSQRKILNNAGFLSFMWSIYSIKQT